MTRKGTAFLRHTCEDCKSHVELYFDSRENIDDGMMLYYSGVCRKCKAKYKACQHLSTAITRVPDGKE